MCYVFILHLGTVMYLCSYWCYTASVVARCDFRGHQWLYSYRSRQASDLSTSQRSLNRAGSSDEFNYWQLCLQPDKLYVWLVTSRKPADHCKWQTCWDKTWMPDQQRRNHHGEDESGQSPSPAYWRDRHSQTVCNSLFHVSSRQLLRPVCNK